MFGSAAQSIQQVSLWGDPGSSKSGKVIQSRSPEVGYCWIETSQYYPESTSYSDVVYTVDMD